MQDNYGAINWSIIDLTEEFKRSKILSYNTITSGRNNKWRSTCQEERQARNRCRLSGEAEKQKKYYEIKHAGAAGISKTIGNTKGLPTDGTKDKKQNFPLRE